MSRISNEEWLWYKQRDFGRALREKLREEECNRFKHQRKDLIKVNNKEDM